MYCTHIVYLRPVGFAVASFKEFPFSWLHKQNQRALLRGVRSLILISRSQKLSYYLKSFRRVSAQVHSKKSHNLGCD